MVADRPAFRRERGLAPHLYGHGRVLPGHHAAACLVRAAAAPAAARAARSRARSVVGGNDSASGACGVGAAARIFTGRAAGAAVHRGCSVLRRDVDAAGAYRRVLRRSRLRPRARCGDAVVDACGRHRQPADFRLDRRSHRRPAHAAAGFGLAGRGTARIPVHQWNHVAVPGVRDVRLVSGRHRAELCADRARIFHAKGSGRAGRHDSHGHIVRHGARRLAVRRHFRSDRFVPRRVFERHRVEPAQHRHRADAALPRARRAPAGRPPCPLNRRSRNSRGAARRRQCGCRSRDRPSPRWRSRSCCRDGFSARCGRVLSGHR